MNPRVTSGAVSKAKVRYGHRLVAVGNVECGQILAASKEYDVRPPTLGRVAMSNVRDTVAVDVACPAARTGLSVAWDDSVNHVAVCAVERCQVQLSGKSPAAPLGQR